MAKAKIKEMISHEVILNLTEEEAQTLACILARVGGSPNKSRRKYVDEIYEALCGIGFSHNARCSFSRGTADLEGSLMFRDR